MADEERVRNLAYQIWESEGRPEGQQQRHWDMALKIVIAEEEAGVDAELEEVGEPVDEPPLLEDDLPLEDDETGIQENRLPLDSPDGEPDFDELPYRDDRDVGRDPPVQDRASPGPATNEPEPTAASTRPLPAEQATATGAQDQDVANRGGADAPATSPEPSAGPLEPLPEESATMRRRRQPRRDDDGLTAADASDTSQVPGKTAAPEGKTSRRGAARSATTAKAGSPSTATSGKPSAAAKGDKARKRGGRSGSGSE
ncbi:DUF2934 domain-containing protein [Halomonas sp. MCCC 1A17488]|uniref:DUF2934 domain-containing protein n=1 Tax=Billgrantia sulfidoxydans TaxID=2733484 RepID=A0ABX7W8Y2_9GAMM|nr:MULTISPECIES: DUF2934 domain-containing protein [Halomonas]MCE8018044.1 DUF2934 domain-containing protein [Halomonas sp. MCCC 1A17488]MCG3241377.1 DUF2934 domain-containing protein [Halomonas sp. MCCC 1A17488]QPP48660.1 DUF2934 domain-containing protein [Halomonas sp. SS10-MC5]QTP56002.1 DUF2934 domain-containing protein [Halomonas sulfidoxydans]